MNDPAAGAAALRAAVAGVAPDAGWAPRLGACRALDAMAAGVPDALRARVALLASFTAEPLVAFLRVEAARLGVWADVWVAPYGQHLQTLYDPASPLLSFRPHVTVVAVDGDALWEMHWASAERDAESLVTRFVEPLTVAVDTFLARGTGVVLLNDVVGPRASADAGAGLRGANALARAVPLVNVALADASASRPGVRLFPLADRVAELGRARAFNRRTHYRGHVSWSDALMADVARGYAAVAAAAVGRAIKCVVLDLDNTLWGGVLGEDGPGGIAIGHQSPGREYLDFQRQLLTLHEAGILLAVASKNNPDEVTAVLRDHPEQLIRDEHLAAVRVGWGDKATSIREIAAELNLGLDQLLFLDDSPHERAWVRRELPELAVPDLPDDPARYADWLATLESVLVLHHSAEDAQRTRQYREARGRAQARETASSEEDFLRALRLRARVEPIGEGTYARAAQLLGKTNQFNLTTRRHDETTLRREIGSGAWRGWTIRVADTFGDFGITGLAIAVPEGTRWRIDSFLLSCRVIGKSVESALLAHIAGEAGAAGADELTAEFIPSGRNAPAADFLPRHGFAQGADALYRRDLRDGGPRWPDWVASWDSPARAPARTEAA
jgi:FkbH-like protein